MSPLLLRRRRCFNLSCDLGGCAAIGDGSCNRPVLHELIHHAPSRHLVFRQLLGNHRHAVLFCDGIGNYLSRELRFVVNLFGKYMRIDRRRRCLLTGDSCQKKKDRNHLSRHQSSPWYRRSTDGSHRMVLHERLPNLPSRESAPSPTPRPGRPTTTQRRR